MKLLYTICYVSKAAENITNKDVEDVFKVTEKANNDSGISGILLHSFGNFFQVLEGEKKMLEKLYEDQIKKDKRHHNIYEIFHTPTKTPIFANYFSKFQTITTSIQLDEIRSYLNSNLTNSNSEKLSRLLRPFMIFDA